MTVRALRQPLSIEFNQPVAGVGAPPTGGQPPAGVFAVDGAVAAGESGKPLVRPEWEYLVFLAGVLTAGAVLAAVVDSGETWKAGPDVSAFAMIFVMTTAIERLIEIFSPFVGGTSTTGNPDPDATAPEGRAGKKDLVQARDRALVKASQAPAHEQARVVAWYDELIAQIGKNKSTLWALGAALGMVSAASMGILLLHFLEVPSVSREIDFIVTGLVIGGGTKALHELVESIQASKESNKGAI
jgi:hypothetical protein